MYTHVYVTQRMISHFTIHVSLYMCNSFDLECHPKIDVFVGTFNKIYLKKAVIAGEWGGYPLEETLGSRSFSPFLVLSLSPHPHASCCEVNRLHLTQAKNKEHTTLYEEKFNRLK